MTIGDKQGLLLSTRMRFGLECAVPREKALDKIVEKAIFLQTSPILTPSKLIKFLQGNKIYLRENIVRDTLKRLERDGKISVLDGRIIISETDKTEIESEILQFQKSLSRITERLFNDLILNEKDKENYKNFFIDFLSNVFNAFGNQWCKLVLGSIEKKDFVDFPYIESLFRKLFKDHNFQEDECSLIKKKCIDFFIENEPDFVSFKFLAAQAFYTVKLLEIESPIDYLSKETFQGSKYYLDTNIILSAFLPSARHHKSFEELFNLCKKINMELCVTEITKQEILAVVYFKAEESRNYIYVPESLREKVKSDEFYKTYISLRTSNSHEDALGILFKPFIDIKESLEEKYKIFVEDDMLFVTDIPDIAELKKILNKYSLEIRNRNKNDKPLEHDARVSIFLKSKREENPKTWFLSLDSSLPPAFNEINNNSPLCFTLDSFLQSISPFVTTNKELNTISEVFSDVMASQLLFHNGLFDIKDFKVFHDLNIDCQKMPNEVIDEYLTHIKKDVLKGEVYSEEHLKEIAYDTKRFFAEPSEKYLELFREKDREIEANKKIIEDKDRTLADVEGKLRGEMEVLRENLEGVIGQLTKNVSDKMGEIKGQKEEHIKREEKSLRQSANDRFLALFVPFMFSEIMIVVFSLFYGEGNNWFQKIAKSIPYLGLVMMAFIVLGWFYLGKDRIKALGWAFNKIFKSE